MPQQSTDIVVGQAGTATWAHNVFLDIQSLFGTFAAGVVNSLIAGSGISVSSATGNVTVTNTGVRSLTASTGVTVSATTGAISINTPLSTLNISGTNITANTKIQSGSNTLSGSAISITFPVAFSGTPQVFITSSTTGSPGTATAYFTAGAKTNTSFVAYGSSASQSFDWYAIGV